VCSDSNIPDQLKISLLRANLKLFFKRPLEMFNIVTNLFTEILENEETRMNVRDYATMLYRGIENNIDEFRKEFMRCRSYSEGVKLPFNELEFDTLEVAYMRKSSYWLIDKNKYAYLHDELSYKEDPEAKPEERILSELEHL
jgi:hypothetical protein